MNDANFALVLFRFNKTDIMKKIIAFCLVLLLAACARVPISNRKQVNLLAESELIEMSKVEYNSFLSQHQVVNYGEQYEMVKRVGEKLAAAATEFLDKEHKLHRVQGFEWEFSLVESNELNAWCMPGGKICFYTGILDVCQDEQGVAVVMGHEIAHAIARHGNERMSKGGMVNLGGQILDVAISQQSESARYLLLNAYGIGAQVGYILPFSRKHELEADMMGLVFMKLAGYDVNEAEDFWKRMSEKGGSVPEFLSTHPNDEKRAQEIRDFINSDDFRHYTN